MIPKIKPEENNQDEVEEIFKLNFDFTWKEIDTKPSNADKSVGYPLRVSNEIMNSL